MTARTTITEARTALAEAIDTYEVAVAIGAGEYLASEAVASAKRKVAALEAAAVLAGVA